MVGRVSRFCLRVLAASLIVSTVALTSYSEDDPDPNSPTPILLTLKDSTRALAIPERALAKLDISRIESQAFEPNTKVVLFVTNLALIKGEGANAFRLNVQDANGHRFRFPITAIEPLAGNPGIYAVTTLLTDEIGFWAPPSPTGDIAISVTWRGLASNPAKLGYGQTGGGVGEITGAVPAPVGTTAASIRKNKHQESLSPEYVGYRWSGDRTRFLEQATFGPTAALDNRIRRIGLKTWLAEQFDAPYPTAANPYPEYPLKPNNAPADCDNNQTVPDVPVTCFRDTYSMYQPQTWFFREAFYGDAQLRHRVVWALNQVWVTSGFDVQQSRHMVEYHKILSKNAFGNYRTLMKEMTLNPAMGGYLDMAISTKNNPNENYAREIKQLFTVGLFLLNPDGTLQTDGNGDPIPTYDQNVVNNLTKVLTGWTFCQAQGTCPNVVVGTVNYIDPLLLNTNNHDLTAKTLLSYPGSTTTNVIACPAPCTTVLERTNYANASMDQALDNIFNHPNVGPFIGKILIQHLVTSDPTPAYVSRVANVFNNNGAGVRGDMKAVVRAILLDPEARGDVKTDPNFGKLREPVMYATNILRAFGVRSADGLGQTDGFIASAGNGVNARINEFNGMGQVPFFSPTVFNFYPPDYKIPGTTLLGPEFAILTTGTTIQRTNFVNRFVFNAIPIAVLLPNTPAGLSLDFSDLQALSTADPTGNLLVDELDRRLLHTTMTPAMKSSILTAVTSVAASDPLTRTRQAIYLVATSTQFQVQR